MLSFGPARRAPLLPALLAAFGVAVGLPSLAFPFGWDTAVHYYVGREWALRGAVPYAATFDHKTPGIHAVHAACVALFGEHMWPIRVVELLCVGAIGAIAAALAEGAATGRARRSPSTWGLGVFASFVFVYGFFDYGNTAQCELPATSLLMGSLLCVQRRRPFVAGALGALSALVKPSLLLLVLLGMVARARTRRARSFGRLAVGASLVVFATVGYFGTKGALGAMWDCVVGANIRYASSEGPMLSGTSLPRIAVEHFRHFSPVSTLLVVLLLTGGVLSALGPRRGRRTRWGLAAALTMTAIAGVFVQRKFFPYHWSPLVAGVALAVVALAIEIPRRFRAVGAAGIAAVVAFAFTQTGPQYRVWRGNAEAVADRALGRIDDEALAKRFVAMPAGYRWADALHVGRYIRARAGADDLVAVRGVSAEIYAVSGCAAPTRFFWTSFLTSPTRAYQRDAWLAEDDAALAAHPPRWMVTVAGAKRTAHERSFLADRYVVRTQIGPYAVHEWATASAEDRALTAR